MKKINSLDLVELLLWYNLGAILQGENILCHDAVPLHLLKGRCWEFFKKNVFLIIQGQVQRWLYGDHLHHPYVDTIALLGGRLQGPIIRQLHQVGHLVSCKIFLTHQVTFSHNAPNKESALHLPAFSPVSGTSTVFSFPRINSSSPTSYIPTKLMLFT